MPPTCVHVHSSSEEISSKMIAAFQADYSSVTRAATVCLRLRMGEQQRQSKNFEGQRYNLKATIRLEKKERQLWHSYERIYREKGLKNSCHMTCLIHYTVYKFWHRLTATLTRQIFLVIPLPQKTHSFLWTEVVQLGSINSMLMSVSQAVNLLCAATAYQLSTTFCSLVFSGEMGSG